MKKLLLLISLSLIVLAANAQVINFRWYDSVQVWPKFNIRNLPQGQPLDSLLSRNGLTNTQRIHPRQLPISTATQAALDLKFDKPTGTTGQVVLGNGTLGVFPSYAAGNRIAITGTPPNLTISYIEPTIYQVSRNVNTNYTIGTKQAMVFYSIPVTATNPLLAGTSVGTAFLEYSTNAGSSWTTALSTSSSSQVGLAVAIALTTGGSNIISGVVPASALVRIRTTVSGTATVGNATGQEVY